MNTFIKAAECWIPSADQPVLQFGMGAYGEQHGFSAVSRSMFFGMGEGLPGLAWEAGRPILLKDFDSQDFRRAEAIKAAGYQCAVAVPCFQAEKLMAVLVLYAGEAGESGGLELWGNDPRVTSDLTLREGFYGDASHALEPEAKDTYLPRGAGLPGTAWQRDAVVYLKDLNHSPRFLRGASATLAGLQAGLAFPIAARGAQSFVLTMLFAKQAPLARRMEVWAKQAGSLLQPTLEEGENIAFVETLPAVQRTLDTGIPQVIQGASPEGGQAAWLVTIPVGGDGSTTEVLALYC